MSGGRLRRIGGIMVIVVGVAVIVALATGEVELVTTHGISMLPRFHTGDLAIIIPSSGYHVGEIVGYRSPLLHITVLHRIVAEHHGLYTFKGDNNSFLDPVKLPASAIQGLLWARIPHGGVVLGWVRSPGGLAVLASLVVVLGVAGGTTRRRRARRGHAGSGANAGPVQPSAASHPPTSVPSLTPPWWGPVGVPLALVGMVALFTTVAWTHPTTRPSTHNETYSQRVTFSYRATAPAGVTYPTGSVVTGDPVFLRLVHTLDVTARYALAPTAGGGAPAPAPAVSGTIGATAVLQGPGGWSGPLATVPPVAFSGTTATVVVPVDLSRIASLELQFAYETGTPIGTTNIAVIPTVHVHGSFDGVPVVTGMAPPLTLELSSQEISLMATPAADGSSTFPQLTVDHTGSVSHRVEVPARLTFVGRSVNVSAARRLGLLGLILSIAATVLGALWVARRRRMDEPTLIRATYGDELIAVSASPATGASLVVDVATFAQLAQLARRYECVILEHAHPGGQAYYVETGATVYRCGVDPVREAVGRNHDEPTLFPVEAARAEPVPVATGAVVDAAGPDTVRRRRRKVPAAYAHLDRDTAAVATEVELLTTLARAEWISGVGNAGDHLHQAVILAQKAGLHQAMIDALLVNVRTEFDVGQDSNLEKIELLDYALDRVGDHPALRARLLGALAVELIFVDDPGRRGPMLDEARELAHGSGDALAFVDVWASHFQGRPRATWCTSQFQFDRLKLNEALDEAVALGQPQWVATLQSQAASYALIDGDGARLRAHLRALSDTSGGGRNQVAERARLRFEQAVATLEGRPVDAEARSTEGAELRRVTGLDGADKVRVIEQLAIRREQGRLDELMAALSSQANARPHSVMTAALAFALAQSGCRHEAAIALFKADCRGFADIPDDVDWPLAVALWSEVAAGTGDVDCALALHEILQPSDGVGMCADGVSAGPASRLLALLELVLDRPDDADRHFAEAIAYSRRLESPVWTARCQLDWAEAWTARGEAGEATQLIEDADAAMGTLVLPALRRQSSDLRHRLGR